MAGDPSYANPIERHSPVPYYLQLKGVLSSLIESGKLRPGDPIPSEAELCRTYGLSRTAIRNALNLLEREGRIHRSKGKRTVVSRRVTWDFHLEHIGLYRDYVEPYRLRAVLENRLVTPDQQTARLLDVPDGGTLLDVQALYDGPVTRETPAVFVHLGLITDASPEIQRIVEAGRVPQFEVGGPSLVMQLREMFKVELGYSISTVTAIACAPKEARILGVPERTATLRVDLIGHSASSRPVLKIRATPHNKHAGLKFLLRY